LLHAGQPVHRDGVVYGDKLIGKLDGMAIFFGSPMERCDFDFDGFSGFSGAKFLRLNGVYYATPEEAKEKSGIEKHLVMLDPATLFVRGLPPTRNPVHDRR